MTESKKEMLKWKKHEIEKDLGNDQYRNNQLWAGNFYFIIGADSQFGYIWPYKKRNPLD
ncbi:Hypothetical protein CINCED_3A006394 [Cinara cedri]|uniref:Uncharacterized protein n=1 Tax=Cinara cedri TaxID=506608 RepID=A0A5E4MM66_9HEMI|nr:Hypothetical protein CINCED_3A006394 [Cinara cedri]